MKTLVALSLAGTVLMTTVTTAMASHGNARTAALVPAHGSIWMGGGLDRFVSAEVMPAHGSVWFGGGLEHLGAESTP